MNSSRLVMVGSLSRAASAMIATRIELIIGSSMIIRLVAPAATSESMRAAVNSAGRRASITSSRTPCFSAAAAVSFSARRP